MKNPCLQCDHHLDGNPGMKREMISDTITTGERPVDGNLVHLEVRCNGCGRLLLSIECDPAADAIGILVCPGCGDESMFDVTDMMAGLEDAR